MYDKLKEESDKQEQEAIDFINDTKEEENTDEKSQPTEITVIEKRPLRAKVALGIGIVALGVMLTLSVVYIARELYNYFA